MPRLFPRAAAYAEPLLVEEEDCQQHGGGRRAPWVERLPEPLTLERLRSHQQRVLQIGYIEMIAEIARQFRLDHEQACRLEETVFYSDQYLTIEVAQNERARPPGWPLRPRRAPLLEQILS